MQGIDWRIGCSGFYYPEWKERFYPKGLPQRQWFEYYCQHFNTLEINNTFYRFPQVRLLEGWQQRSSNDFLFTVKATRTITHLKPFTDTAAQVQEFYATVAEGLGTKLGTVLFQLPPRAAYTPALLEAILEQLDSSFRNVIEFRHSSWWREEVYQQLAQKGIVFSGVSFPDLPDEVITQSSVVYYRFHGVPRLYHSGYAPAFLDHVVHTIGQQKQVQQAWLYFNNTASGVAPTDARHIQEKVGYPIVNS